MYVKNLNYTQLYNYLRNARTIGSGHFNYVLYHNDEELIKVSRRLFDRINPNYYNQNDKCDSSYYCFKDLKERKFYFTCNLDQIEYFCSMQKDIKLTKFPIGILACENVPCGLILPNHKNHINLSDLTHVTNQELKDSGKTYASLYSEKIGKLTVVLYNLLLALRELELHEISQDDLAYNYNSSKDFNVLVKGLIPQIIDLDGEFVKYKDSYNGSNEMYLEFGVIMDILDDIFKLDSCINFSKINNYDNAYNALCEINNLLNEKRLIK